jgi:uncharacterized protein (TIGR02145 family)
MYLVSRLGIVGLVSLIFFIASCKKDKESQSIIVEDRVTDIDGNVYKTVKIGDQWWMAENLKTTKYRNGDPIPHVTNNNDWTDLSTPAYCSYNNDNTTYGSVYGLLYNWYALDPASNGNKNICPEGWHIPTDEELTTLINNLGGAIIAGGKLKEAGTSHWSIPNTGATNTSGFTALPAGFRSYVDGSFQYVGVFSHWWTSTQTSETQAWNLGLFNIDASANHSASEKKLGFSIRCVKD